MVYESGSVAGVCGIYREVRVESEHIISASMFNQRTVNGVSCVGILRKGYLPPTLYSRLIYELSCVLFVGVNVGGQTKYADTYRRWNRLHKLVQTGMPPVPTLLV